MILDFRGVEVSEGLQLFSQHLSRGDSNTPYWMDQIMQVRVLSDFFLPVIAGIAGLAEQSRWDSSLDVLSLMSSVDVEEWCCQIEKCTECESHPLNQSIVGYQA